MTEPCKSCAAARSVTPLSTANRPGLSTLSYRVGNYSTFFDTMKGRLSQPGLTGLRTREAADPAIALLDAWSIVADVLTFYQERIANEGYLRTAVERGSVLELADLVGSSLRPGVSATVSIAYTLDQNSVATIPVGSRVQSLPVQDQLPQSFEISDDLPARGAWNNLVPRLSRPQIVTSDASTVYVAGLTANLKPNDPLLVVASPQVLQRVQAVEVQAPLGRTKVDIQMPVPPQQTLAAVVVEPVPPSLGFVNLIEPLTKAPASHPVNAALLSRSVASTFDQSSDAVPALVRTLNPATRAQFYTALMNEAVAPPVPAEVHAFRVKAAPFGHNAPLKPVTDEKGVVIGTEEWPLAGVTSIEIVLSMATTSWRRGDTALAYIEALFNEKAPLAFVQIEQGSEKASQSFLIDNTASPAIGRWQMDASFDSNSKSVKFNLSDLGWSCTITFLNGSSQIEVVVDGGDDIKVPVGRTATSSSTGRRLRVSTEHGIAIEHEAAIAPDKLNVVDLDSAYDQIIPQSWVAIDFANGRPHVITQVKDVQKVSVTNYGMSGRVTRLTLDYDWLTTNDLMLSAVRPAAIMAQSELLVLAEEPIDDPVEGKEIELGDLYGDLPSGRWLIVGGERVDIPNTTGVNGAELVMLAGVEQKTQLADPTNPASAKRAGERLHSFLELAGPLAYRYKRNSVAVYGNVIPATHGEARVEVLGSGDGSQAMQHFTLRQGPLTHVTSATRSGTQSTLEVRVNDIPWTEVAALTEAGPFHRCYVTRTDDADKTTIVFGDGVNGMRAPTGKENVKAIYRTGLGSAGNVLTGAISQLASRPFGVKAVASPLPASGGVDRDGRDQGKKNVSLLGASMDRLVSVQDYADFARTFGGIGNATAALLSDGRRELVHVTVAPADANHVNSDQYPNLLQALLDAGDPHFPVQVEGCELVLLIIAARVGMTGDRQWAEVEPDIRTALLDAFGYDRRDLGQDIALSEVIGAIQLVAGVAYVDVTTFDSISTSNTKFESSLKAKLAAISSDAGPASLIRVRRATIDPVELRVQPAQIAFLSADLLDTLVLTGVDS
jgi:predicted phage baseplate assembly protein